MDDFQIVKLIGKGTFGRVYKYKNKKDNKYYAIKKINILRQGKTDSIGLLTELQILFNNKCPFILKYHGCYLDTNEFCMISRYCSKGDLERLVKNKYKIRQYLDENTIYKIFLQICYGIHYLHSNNVIHRDLKTANIFVEKDYKIKIGDFGISKILGSDNLTSTQIGTPLYLSPEVVRQKKYGLKTDIWSLGCVLYELIMLKPAFTASSMSSLVSKIKYGQFLKVKNNKDYNKNLLDLVNIILVIDDKKRLTINQILELDSIKDKIYLGPYYEYDSINTDDIPNLDNNLTKNISNSIKCWNSISEIYKDCTNNILSPDYNIEDNNIKENNIKENNIVKDKFNFNTVLPSIKLRNIDKNSNISKNTFNNSIRIKNHSKNKKEINKYIKLPNINNINNNLLDKKKYDKQESYLPNRYSPRYHAKNFRIHDKKYGLSIERDFKPSPITRNYPKYKHSIYNRNPINHNCLQNNYKPKTYVNKNLYSYGGYNPYDNVLIKIGSRHDPLYKPPLNRRYN